VPALILPEAGKIAPGDQVRVDPVAGRVENLTQNKNYAVEPLPPHLMEMIHAGGLMPYLKTRIAGEATHDSR
jgi:3-isopropylmalate/(R)-2-methylmalate dehydratase small subunit